MATTGTSAAGGPVEDGFATAPTSPMPQVNGSAIASPQSNGHAVESSGGAALGAGPPPAAEANRLEVLCGPLINYKYMQNPTSGGATLWQGSILLVTKPTQTKPNLRISCTGMVSAHDGSPVAIETLMNGPPPELVDGTKLYEDTATCFWRFDINVPFQDFEARWTYDISNLRFVSGDDPEKRSTASFFVPSKNQSMRIMFHSCNGFSVGTDEDAWSGPALWNDVLRTHIERPIHVMLGGGDQIYNDSVRVKGPLKEWTAISNPKKRRDYPFDRKMRDDCDKFYLDNYIRWYSTEPFQSGNCSIPQVNIWDDHDIIDGFGSYTDHFMKCHVFRGIGGVAHKYYLLFQHHVPPPPSTFTTDAPQTTHTGEALATRPDSVQLKESYIKKDLMDEPAWIIGPKPGPYVEERSRSLYMQLGKRIAMVGIDARTERTRHQINYPETYKLIWDRVNKELAARNGEVRHLIVLLGIPIAYPRLEWLNNLFRSPIIGPIRLLNKRFGLAGGLFNKFDGQVDLLDDLDDHYTARNHKRERKELVLALQSISQQHGVRITLLGGDVHLCAMGRFYSKPKLAIPTERDHRFMPNIVSSAITNKPPPKAVADLLAARNKIHRFDSSTHETLLNFFDKDPGEGSTKTAARNHATMPSRNYAIMTLNESEGVKELESGFKLPENGHDPLHQAEQSPGTKHYSASGQHSSGLAPAYGLEVALRVEIDQHDRQGKTDGYGLAIPALSK